MTFDSFLDQVGTGLDKVGAAKAKFEGIFKAKKPGSAPEPNLYKAQPASGFAVAPAQPNGLPPWALWAGLGLGVFSLLLALKK